MKEKHGLTVAAIVDNLVVIAEFINQVATDAGFDDRANYAMQMAVDEACTNIIEHAYEDTEAGSIRLECEIQVDGLTVSIFDQGLPFEPDTVPRFDPTASLEARDRRGMGLFYINNLMDAVDYSFNTPNGNRLTLFKRKRSDDELF